MPKPASPRRTRSGPRPQRVAVAQPVEKAELDDLDRALIERLRRDGRESNRSLATRLNVNEVTVAARLRRLEETGLMKVVAITDIRLFGHRDLAFAMINVAGRPIDEVARELAEIPEAVSVTVCTGRFDIIVPLLARDPRHTAELFDSVLKGVDGVESAHGIVALDVLKYDSKWSLFVDPGTTPQAQPSETVDDVDLAIIAMLQRNARRSNRNIAAELKVSEGTVRSRIKRMLGDRVFRIQAITDIAASGVGAHAFLGIRTAPHAADGVAAALAKRDDVGQVTRVLDHFDLIAVIFGTDHRALAGAVIREIALLPGVARAEMFDGYNTLKHTYAWTWIV
ncbi:Lrp/AsnC family transcriptional regulator [Mycobacterium arosiense]|uniref:HTH asnC-type domain-containing protein n=1 Tax=Mycobacterium arosiense ATCC BAA-1401 = DSM 45069 TaxID=1265311 RepID=A0A1W9ZBN7_MYCAI|nr:Lrp/AsnC family transcriptional regulator [Mycobacterium arosiense]ORA11417.1 hypothetical protein BST14_18570 [Mycobacterium arosiense ATCC BAA-1401 = DSM 45069]